MLSSSTSSLSLMLLFRCRPYSQHNNSRTMSTIGFIGLGNMGKFMASNLIKAGHVVRGYDVDSKAVSTIQGLIPSKSPAHAAENADAVITMLPSNAIVLSTFLDSQQGIFSQGSKLKPGALLIDSSTVNPNVSKQLSDMAYQKKYVFVDAPVSGGVNGAKQGTLTFMVGSRDVSDFEKAKAVLSSMGKNIVHCGNPGTGQVAKICNNLVLGISMIGVSEAMNLGVKLGMDRQVLANIMNTSTARCWSSDSYNPAPGVALPTVPSSNDYEGGFGSSLMLKDLGLASDAAKDVGVPIPLGNAAQALYQTLVVNGLGKKDFSVVYRFLGGK
jgi:3-hydroxyisobutyrate dehydrogenase